MENYDVQHKRRNYFIDKNFQAKFILKFCLVMVLAGLAIIGVVYFFSLQATTVSIVNARVVVRSTADFLLPILWQTAAITLVAAGLVTIGITLIVSHRIAGPLYRFQRVMEAMEEGDFSRGFRLRTNDQFQKVANTMNQMLRTTRMQIVCMKEMSGILKKNLDKIEDGEIVSSKLTSLHEMKRVSKEIDALLGKYKT